MKNPNHPKKGSMIKVDPIRSKKAVENIKKILAGRPRKPGDSFELKESKTQKHRMVIINKLSQSRKLEISFYQP